MDLLQSLNETEEIRDCRRMSPPMEKKCDAIKSKVPKLRSASSVDGMVARRARAAIHKESAEASRPSSCCARREASDPQRVNASTVPWQVIQGVNSPSAQAGSREGFVNYTFLTNTKSGMEALKCALPLKTL